MTYKLERNLFLDGVEYTIGEVLDLPDDERTQSLVESGTLVSTSAKASASVTADSGEVDNSTAPLSVTAPVGQPEALTPSEESSTASDTEEVTKPEPLQAVGPTDEPKEQEPTARADQPTTPEPPASSGTTSPNLHLG